MIPSLMAGVTLGLSVALPFGPISLLCVQRSIAGGFRDGFVAGAGAASAQGLFAAAVWTGHNALSSGLAAWSKPLHWLSAGLLLWLGLRTLIRRNRFSEASANARTPAAFASSLALALSNPLTVLPYVAVASSVTAGESADAMLTPWFVPGVMAGSAAWYALLSGGVSMFRTNLPKTFRTRLNVIAGTMLVLFGIVVALL